MQKYLAVFNISWENMLVYRLNFFLWRVRSVLQLLLIYFIWWTVFQSQKEVFGYTESSILTYILVSSLIRAIVLSTRTTDVVSQINQGDIVNFLVKPINFIKYYLAQDISDKLLNISFVIIEIILLVVFLQPKIVLQTDPGVLFLFILATILGIFLYFALNFTLGLLTFWVEGVWGPIFLLMIFLEGLGGGLFPIDILPKSLASIILLTPFPYLLYFPSKIYLGTMSSSELVSGFIILTFWVIVLWLLMTKTLRLGLKHYTAVGH